MKKTWSLFLILSVVFVTAVTVGGIFAVQASGVLSAVFALANAIVWIAFFAHFRSIEYSVENRTLIIQSGVFVRTVRRISVSDILWRTTVKIGSVVLFSVIHTSAGKAVIFAELDLFINTF